MSQQHPNSKVITIFRLSSFLERAQGEQIQDFMVQSRMSIGSYFQKNSSAIGTGLTPAEIDVLLPRHLSLNKDDRTYRAEVKKFYANLDTVVPFKGGVKLEIGLEVDNDKPISEENLPLNVMDYIRYRHALDHPHVAKDRKGGHGNQLKQYYIFDPTAAKKLEMADFKNKDKALKIYLEIKEDESKVDTMLTMLGEDIRMYDKDEKLTQLKKLAETKADKFVEAFEADHLEERAWIRKMVNTQIIKIVNDNYYVAASMETMGKGEDEAVMTFKDPNSKELVLMLKGKTQEALKKKIVRRQAVK